jgi:hypothetical protein
LVETVRVAGSREFAVGLTKAGKSLLERHRSRDHNSRQTFWQGVKRERELEHDLQVYRAFQVHPTRPADVTLWTAALDRHEAIFGRAPDLAAGDRGFASAGNEQAATERGVRRVVLPRRGPKSSARRAYERQRWFRRGQRWRVGCEGRISVLKRRHGLDRCRYHSEDGMHRWVGLGVIANNLVSTATFAGARATA